MSTAQYISSYRYAEGDITMSPSYPLSFQWQKNLLRTIFQDLFKRAHAKRARAQIRIFIFN
nr:MAG TPA: hypothetical protein [Microviridae sp.]